MSLLGGVLAAFGAAALYSVGISLQAVEARAAPRDHHLRFSLLRRLVRRPRWIAGTAAGLLGWGLQAVALPVRSAHARPARARGDPHLPAGLWSRAAQRARRAPGARRSAGDLRRCGAPRLERPGA